MAEIIIRQKDIVAATDSPREEFRVSDYIYDKSFTEELFLIKGFHFYEPKDGRKVRIFDCKRINPVTLKEEDEKRDISEGQMKQYYRVLEGDPTRLRDIAHRILHEGATVEEFTESSETALMTMGNKESLIALREQVEQSQRAVQVVGRYCQLMQSQMKREIDRKLRVIREVTEKMDKEIKRLNYVIQTIETYAGIKEEVLTLRTGEPASEDTTIVIRQAVLFMDEEFALIDDDFDYHKMESFDKWLLEDDNYKIILPDEKSIVAIKPRRTDKKYSDNWWENKIMNRPNHVTLFLIRNGENLYRLESEHIYLDDRLFPNLDEYQKVLEKEAQEHWKDGEDKRSDRMRRCYTKVAFLLQGLLDRSDVFYPHHVRCSFLKMTGLDETIRMDYELDTSRLLQDGRPSVMDWIRQTNDGIREGSRILLLDGTGLTRENFLRYYGSDYSTPDYPGTGVYTVRKNPQYEPGARYLDKYNCPFCISYKPESDAYSWTDGWTERKNKVSISFDPGRCNILRYDELDLGELDYYLNNRLYRSQYYSYVRLLKTAKSLVALEQRREKEFLSMMAGEAYALGLTAKPGHTVEEIAEKALQTVKNRLKWKRPISSKERETYTLVRRTLFSEKNKEKYFITSKQ